MTRPLLVLAFAVCMFAACGDGTGMDGTPEYQAKKAEEDRKAAEGEKSLFARFDEFVTMKGPLKPGKRDLSSLRSIVVLKKFPAGDWVMEGWVSEPDGSRRRCLESAGCATILRSVTSDSSRAESAESAKTLIRVACEKGKAVKDYKQGIVVGTIYASECQIDIFDLRSNTMLGTKRIKADKVEELTEAKILNSSEIIDIKEGKMVNPYPAIQEYVRQF